MKFNEEEFDGLTSCGRIFSRWSDSTIGEDSTYKKSKRSSYYHHFSCTTILQKDHNFIKKSCVQDTNI